MSGVRALSARPVLIPNSRAQWINSASETMPSRAARLLTCSRTYCTGFLILAATFASSVGSSRLATVAPRLPHVPRDPADAVVVHADDRAQGWPVHPGPRALQDQ